MEYEQRRCGREREKKDENKKGVIPTPNHSRFSDVSVSPRASSYGMHAFAGEFTLAGSVAGASGGTGAHMTIDAFGTPWAFFSYQTQTRPHQQIFLFQM